MAGTKLEPLLLEGIMDGPMLRAARFRIRVKNVGTFMRSKTVTLVAELTDKDDRLLATIGEQTLCVGDTLTIANIDEAFKITLSY